MIKESELKEVVVLDTIPLSEKAGKNEKIVLLTVAPLLASSILAVHNRKSMSKTIFND